MRNYTMPDGQALDKIRPRSRSARNQLLAITIYCLLGVAAVVTIVYSKRWTHRYREQNWSSTIAAVEDVRPKLIGQVNGQTGGEMLYDVEVLAKFSNTALPQERWITVEESPRPLDSALLQERLWKGKKYVVRWNPSNPGEVSVEIIQ